MDARDIQLTLHARDMLNEREIPEEWVWRAIGSPDRVEDGADDNRHI